MQNLGNLLFQTISDARNSLFEQGELAELTYGAFNVTVISLQNHDEPVIPISFPIGWGADEQTINTTRNYGKDELIQKFHVLALHHLALNSLIRIVTIIETLLGDVVRAVVLKYPKKIGIKMTVSMQAVLEAQNIEDLHVRATDVLLNELSYKSPAEFAESAKSLLQVNLMECDAFHKYIEVKATRDIHIHNGGRANDTYSRKAGSHARVRSGTPLPVDLRYFLRSYENCIRLTEWLEAELHEHWHSSELEKLRDGKLLPFTGAVQAKDTLSQPLENADFSSED